MVIDTIGSHATLFMVIMVTQIFVFQTIKGSESDAKRS